MDIGKYLLETYIEITGSKPDGGGWKPSKETEDAILEYVIENYGSTVADLKRFLTDSIKAFVSKHGKDHTTPFFVNSYILAESTLNHLKIFREHVDKIHSSHSPLEGFWGLVKAEILQGEIQFWEGPVIANQISGSLVNPPIWWLLMGFVTKRFDKYPSEWLSGEAYSISHKRYVNKEWAFNYEKVQLSSDKQRRDLLIHYASQAVREAAISWLAGNRLITQFRGPNGDPSINCDDEVFLESVNCLINLSVPLSERDQKLRELVVEKLKKDKVYDEALNHQPHHQYPPLQVVQALFTDPDFVRKYVDHEDE